MQRTLVQRAAAGDRDAFAVLAGDAVDRLYRVAHRIAHDQEIARDATQQALLEAWRDLPGLRDPDRWEAWTYRLTVRACVRELQRDRRAVGRIGGLTGFPAAVPDAELAIADRDQLERGFQRLPPDHRAILVLHHYLGMPLTEIAATLGIPAGTARSRLHNATRRMRAALEADATLPTTTKRHAV
jgi:RNA polymerase sigma-70 factor, ECF subfamily